MPSWLNGLLTAAASGASVVAGQVLSHGGSVSWSEVGIGAAIGAGVGIVNWLRTSPWNPPQATIR